MPEGDETDSGGPAPKRRLMDTGQKLLFEVKKIWVFGATDPAPLHYKSKDQIEKICRI